MYAIIRLIEQGAEYPEVLERFEQELLDGSSEYNERVLSSKDSPKSIMIRKMFLRQITNENPEKGFIYFVLNKCVSGQDCNCMGGSKSEK